MDAYDLQARHAPVVFAILPIVLVAIALVPGLGQMKIAAGSIAFIIVAALPFVATRIARSAGRARQNDLYVAWGRSADDGNAAISRCTCERANQKGLPRT